MYAPGERMGGGEDKSDANGEDERRAKSILRTQ